MSRSVRLLVVEDSDDDYELIVLNAKRSHLEIESERVKRLCDVEQRLLGESWNVVISDYYLPSFTALDVLRLAKEVAPDVPLIVVSGTVGEEHAVEAMKLGAQDFLLKDRLKMLPTVIERELNYARECAAHRKAEARLATASRMESIGRLAGGVAHDFNNILTVILTYGGLLRKQFRQGDPVRSDLDEIVSAAERARNLTSQLLAFSTRQPQSLGVFSPNSVIESLERMLGRLIGEDVELIIELAADIGAIKGDVGQLEQVIMNLVVNARDAMPHGGTLLIETSQERLSAEDASAHGADFTPGKYVVTTVTDTGLGMTREAQGQIFEPFFTTKGDSGSGLGLSTVYGIVRQHGGFISVYSEVGRGTTFKIYLPASELAKKRSTIETELPDATTGEGTILLVEDEPLVRKAIARMLRSWGYEVVEAQNAGEALLIAETAECQIDLLLTDVVMPSMTGTQLAERLELIVPDLRVIFMSGYPDRTLTERDMIGSTSVFVQKPVNAQRLCAAVHQLISDARKRNTHGSGHSSSEPVGRE